MLTVPLFNMQIFNRVLPTRDLQTLLSLCGGLCISILFFSLIEVFRGVVQETLSARLARKLSIPLLQSAALSSRVDASANEAMADLEQLRSFLASRSSMVPFDIVWSPVMLVVLLAMHWALGVFAAACLIAMISLNILGDMISRRSIIAANVQSSTALRSVSESVNAADAVVALGLLPVLGRRWLGAQSEAQAYIRRALLRARAVSAATNAVRASMTGGMVALGLALALNGFASSGSMVAANMILARLLMPLTNFASCRREWLDIVAVCRRLNVALQVNLADGSSAVMPTPSARLVVESLVYVPPGRERANIRNVSFVVEPGEAIAVVGPSSAGKSTLARLLVGIIPPSAGGVYLDGINTFNWRREEFAQHVGFCPQRATVLEESVADNIARLQRGNLGEVVRVAKVVGLHDVIAALPHGYATIVKGNVLSGGQRQRLALARALYGCPKLLVLDEPSAFLDEDAEQELVRILRDLKVAGLTLIVVTHRPKLLTVIDKVVIMHDGAVTHFGTPSELASSLSHRPIKLIRPANDHAMIS
jgi:ATP-binding cassette subfamily C protein